jgi:hypothetical protein
MTMPRIQFTVINGERSLAGIAIASRPTLSPNSATPDRWKEIL